MSLEIALQNAISGLQTSKQSLQVISNNIANVNTPGYTRKIVEQTARVIEGQGYGVEISRIKRSVDEGVLRQLRTESGGVERLTIKEAFLRQVNSLFGKPEDNDSIVHEIADLGAQFDSLAISPETESNQYLTVKAASDITLKLKNMSDQIQRLRSDANLTLKSQIDEFNEKMDLLVSLNSQIIEFTASNISASELEDQRDQALDRMSELMDIKYFEKGDGSLTVFTAGGQTLVDGQAQHLTYNRPSGLVPTLEYTPTDAVNYIIPGQTGYPVGGIPGIFVGEQIKNQDITSSIGSGSIRGLIDMRDNELPSLQAQIDELAEKLKDAINTVHNTGTGFPPVVGMTGDRYVTANMALSPATNDDNASGIVRIAVVNEAGALQNDTVFDLSDYDTVGQLVTAINAMTNVTASINSTGRLVIAAENNNRLAINEMTSSINAAGDLGKGFSDFFGLNNFYQSNQNFSQYRSDLVSSASGSAATTGGTLQFTMGAATASVNYASGASLNGIATAINAVAALSTTAGITAQVIADGAGFRLQVTDAQGDEFTMVETAGGSLLEDLNPRADYRGISNRMSVREDIAANSFYVSRGALQSNTFTSPFANNIASTTAFLDAGASTVTTDGSLDFTLANGQTTSITYAVATESLQDIVTKINSDTILSAAGITAEIVTTTVPGTPPTSQYSLKISDSQSDNFWIEDDTGDLGVVTDQGASVGDGSVAAAIAAAFNESNTFLASPARGGGLARTDATFTDYGASILSFNAAQTDAIARENTFRQNLTAELFNKNSSISGVNMDEELANLIIYEQAYLAASRMIATTQELYKALTEMLG
ncbi:MAG: flgK [Rhodospirillales bacterium]|jgi:flagellar hook-associated protein 1 FlgK|nr:flgK [Rhodospirillales bacterium]